MSSTRVSTGGGVRVSDRFQKIPRLQQDREAEYTKQATEAEELLCRLHGTRVEAEAAAREEIERTRAVQIAEFQTHPEIVKWRRSISETEIKMGQWVRTASGRKEELRARIRNLEGQLSSKQRELERLDQELKTWQDHEMEIRGKIDQLQGELDRVHVEFERAQDAEESFGVQLSDAYKKQSQLQSELEGLKAERIQWGSNLEELRRRESTLKSERSAISSQLDKVRLELATWEHRVEDTEDEFNRALQVQTDAQALAEQHRQRMEQLNQDKEGLARQTQNAMDRKEDALNMLTDIDQRLRAKEAQAKQLEDAARPVRSRMNQIQEEIRKLRDEAASLDTQLKDLHGNFEREQMEAEQLRPTLGDCEQQLKEATELHRRSQEQYAGFMAIIAEEGRKMGELEVKAEEAHREVLRAQELRTQTNEGLARASDSVQALTSSTRKIEADLSAIQGQLQQTEKGGHAGQVEAKEQELRDFERNLRLVIDMQRSSKSRREDFGHQLQRLESDIRLNQQELEQGRGRKRFGYLESLQKDVARLQKELDNCQTELPQMDANPYEMQLASLRREEAAVESRVYAYWTPETAPPRLIDQLKRETEAVLRAEAALALERRQRAICEEARSLSRFHINTKPRFEIDEDARRVLLNEHREGIQDRQIAKSVLEMCQQHHIHV